MGASSDPTAPDWWRGAVIYQVYPRSFLDTDGDGVGDLAGVHRGLDYIARLGVDAIWLSPFFISPMKDFGYDVSRLPRRRSDVRHPRRLRRLCGRAHDLGLKVIIDQVWSHTSDQAPVVRRKRRLARQPARPTGTSGPTPSRTARRPTTGWPRSAARPGPGSRRRRQYYLHNFLAEQPDLNFWNPEVQDAILDVARFWLDRGVDGFRLDVVNYSVPRPRC